ncbi:PREDICTED: uncharacterized protein LOC109217052 [Nicotiana attenuata]|uniref:uncharacterized protein LOC109217052 n=1 Tax=Nicotiana attenuata TaxID=49451 RepID=UPI00090546DB|nr:PREDICTED: uncharacterized protein LOC109217052 [Nicotiana attenuata]
MDVSVELPEEVSIEIPGGKCKLQNVEYEWRPLYCQSCLNIGHQNGECKKTTLEKGKQQTRKPKMGWRVKENQQPTKPATNAEKQAQSELPKEVEATTGDQNEKDQHMSLEFQVQQAKNRGKKKLEITHEQEGTVSFEGDSSMIFCSWNIRGLNKPFKQKELKTFLLTNKVVLIGVLEAKVKVNKAEKVKKKMGNDWEIAADYTQSPNGRIWIAWKPQQVEVQIVTSMPQFVHCIVNDKGSTFTSQITFVYGLNTINERRALWQGLRNLNNNIADPQNGIPIHPNEVKDFQECIEDIGLGQLKRTGNLFSWSNKRDAHVRIHSLIDWAFGNSKWFDDYGQLEAVYLSPECSDHSPIIVNTGSRRQNLPRPFRLLNILLQNEEFKAMTKTT